MRLGDSKSFPTAKACCILGRRCLPLKKISMQLTVQNPTIAELARRLDTLPAEQLRLALEFIDFLAAKYEHDTLSKGISQLNAASKSFAFLNDEPDALYSAADLLQIYPKPKP
jgi:hypothetical protein